MVIGIGIGLGQDKTNALLKRVAISYDLLRAFGARCLVPVTNASRAGKNASSYEYQTFFTDASDLLYFYTVKDLMRFIQGPTLIELENVTIIDCRPTYGTMKKRSRHRTQTFIKQSAISFSAGRMISKLERAPRATLKKQGPRQGSHIRTDF